MEPPRLRTLTYKMMEQFQERVQSFEKSLSEQWLKIEEFFKENLDECDELGFKRIKNQTFEVFRVYDVVSSDYVAYLRRTRTQEAESKAEEITGLAASRRTMVNEFLSKIRSAKYEKLSQCSSSSKLTINSIKLREAKAMYAEKEAELEKVKLDLEEKAKIEAASVARKLAAIEIEKKLLLHKKELACSEAENFADKSPSLNVGNLPSVHPQVRTALYVHETGDAPELNPNAEDFVPASHTNSDFTRFLLKKDILTSRLTVFNDQPETYQSWKVTFCSVSKEIKASAEEEIDLLIKWLGVLSRKQAVSLKAAYIHDLPSGLKLIWERLDERYGAPENIYHATAKKLECFPKISPKDYEKLYELSDIISEIEGHKKDPRLAVTLAYFDSAVGVNQIVSKLPYNLQEKWTTHAANYKRQHYVPFPPFNIFAQFIREQSRIRNDPSFKYEPSTEKHSINDRAQHKKVVSVKKTEVEERCPIHKASHSLQDCREFKSKSHEEKKKVLSENKLCFRCLRGKHTARECKNDIKCSVCSSRYHCSSMHSDNTSQVENRKTNRRAINQGGEIGTSRQTTEEATNRTNVVTSCTEVCGNNDSLGKSCAKIVLVNVYNISDPNSCVKCYAIIDDQSNRSLAKPKLFSMLGLKGESHEYVLKSCGGTIVTTGRRTDSCVVESLDKSVSYSLPTLIECNEIPSDKSEICTADNARRFNHLSCIADLLPEFDANADILLLLGRDVGEVHHVLDQVIGPTGLPFAQRLSLGWVVIGELCLGQVHAPKVLNVYKTHVLKDGRTSLFEPCGGFSVSVQDPIFVKTKDDNKVGPSIEDREFIQIMDSHFHKGSDGGWVAPLPFRSSRSRLPNNRSQAVKRANILTKSLEKNEVKQQHFVQFMEKLFNNGHAEIAPKLSQNEECWYLPIFGVYHPRKPNQVRVVFDSSAVFEGVSLNSVLLQGPDLVNSLQGVLIRFRKDIVAFMADIEQMFYSFSVEERDRNFLRFLWHQDNDLSKPLIEYRMCKHVFGNSPSPSVATYGLRRSVESSSVDVREYVTRDFYVDDGLSSQPSGQCAIDLLSRAQLDLRASNLRLHKIASNCSDIMKAFPSSDLAKGLEDVDLESDDLPSQRSLGLVWNIGSDTFVFKADMVTQPVSKRGLLATINSVFDPLGFVAPVILKGRLILREVMSNNLDWDDEIPIPIADKWGNWLGDLVNLRKLGISRSYFPASLSLMARVELHVFSDASIHAISAVVYVLGRSTEGEKHIGFVLGKSKLSPEKGHTIPRLELCGAVLAVDLFQSVSENLYQKVDAVKFYTDSKIVLGYIGNKTRRFHTYVSNRVQKILAVTDPLQWNYVPSEKNPADIGSRGATVDQLGNSLWLSGPSFLVQEYESNPEIFPLIEPDLDKEIRKVTVKSTKVVELSVVSRCFERFSTWLSLVRAISILKHIAESYHLGLECKGWHVCHSTKDLGFEQSVVKWIFKMVQLSVYVKEVMLLSKGSLLNKDSNILSLDPVVGNDGLLRVGGRLGRSEMSVQEKNPIIIPPKHPVAELLVRHYHSLVHHQGRHFTEGAIRSAGLWVVGGKRIVQKVIHNCVVCRKLRGMFASQKMSELPVERVNQSSPFSHVGVDVFGPWHIVTRRTRGGMVESKRWAVLFTCLCIRAVHIEIIEDMSSSSFTNALRRFVAIRGSVKVFRSDRGTNFIGAIDNIKAHAINVEDDDMQSFCRKSGSVWIFNSPHSSHMGGVWERMIGVARRILEAMLLNVKTLTHEVLVTLMAEVSAIINSRPIVPVSSDPDVPEVLSPSALLTQKLDCDEVQIGDMSIKNLYLEQWKQVQYLASRFWVRWKSEYLQTLQTRRKWNEEREPLKINDVVLMKDLEVNRCSWPMGRISNVFPSADGRVRKVEVCVIKEEKKVFYTRPVTDLVLLVEH